MSLPPSTSKKSCMPNLNKIEGAKKGKRYEITLLLTLAKKGYELSIDKYTKFRDFSIGREVGIGKYRKFDDVVFSYVDQDNRKNLIFLQLKHCQYRNLIDSFILSTETDTAKDVAAEGKASDTRTEDVRYGYMRKNFNLQQYFISFLSARDELAYTNSEDVKGGKIKYVVMFTNHGLDDKELKGKGFSFNEAPGDIVDLFTLSSEAQHKQLGNVSEGLRKILEKSSDLDRLARELARYVVFEDYRKNRIMGNQETPIKYYHAALEREVIQKLTPKQVEKGQHFCKAQFREKFLNCNETSTNLYPLRKALFETIRDLDESKKGDDDDELKRVIKQATWKIVYNCDESIQTNFPCEWIPVRNEDIQDFLQCFVFMVNQPGVKELELLYNQSIQSDVVENTPLKQFVGPINATGPEFKDCVERVFGLELKPHNDEKWIPRNQFENFRKKKQRLLQTIYEVSAMTLMYKKEIMQYGKFNDFGKILKKVKNFLTSGCKILCINTPATLLSSIKMSQTLNEEVKYPISLSLNILNSIENRDCVLKAFEHESTSLLTIECRHQDVKFLDELLNITKKKSNKKIILIMQQENCERFKLNFKDEEIYVVENDSIEIKDFEPKEDPLAKKVLVFQGQKERVSLSDITGIDSWPSYVHTLSQGTNEQGVIDEMTLEEILINDKIKVGSKPAGTSSLEGAYAQMYEEINVENLVVRLTSQEHGNDTNDIYIISGITEFSKQDKTDKVIQYLGLNNNKEIIQNQFGDIGSEGKIQVADDKFKDKNFQRLCHRYPEKRIFWICCDNKFVNKTKFILQEIYNPKFYLKRKFQNVIIKEDLKELLFQDDLSETFIFCCVKDKEQLYKSMGLNEHEVEQFEDNCKIRVFFYKSDAETCFRQLSEKNETAHLLEFEKEQFVWCKSHGSVNEHREIFLIEEDKLIRKIKDRKVVMFADDPGMGKTTTLIKLYETEIESPSIIKSHWIIRIKLRDHLEAVLDLEFQENSIDTLDVIEFLSNIDSKLNSNLAKNLLKIVLDKSKSFQAKPLLLIFDGFDEVLDEDYRKRILLLLQFIKDKTAAKLWITTRCHFKNLLEETLSTIAIQFSPMDDAENAQYIATYLQHRLFLTLNNKKYTELFDTDDKKQKLQMYTAAFINKMKSIFRGDISTFIGTPLQLYLMLENTVKDFKNWIEGGDDQISVFKHVRNDVWDVYDYFIGRKYEVYFLKKSIRERDRQRQEKFNIERYHKSFAQSKILDENPKKSLDEFKDIYLLAGVIKSQGTDPEFIHKTFEEFFAAKAFIDWIKEVPNTKDQEGLLTEIFMKPDYRLIRTFMNLQLHKMTEQVGEVEAVNELDKNLDHYGKVAADLFNKETNPLINKDGQTPLYIAVQEGNKDIACFLLNILKRQPDVLQKFLFNPKPYFNTPLHLACMREDVQIVKALLDAAAGISKDTLQESIVQTFRTARNSENVEICKELLGKANDKLKIIWHMCTRSPLCTACLFKREKYVELYLQEYKHDNHSLRQLLLYNDSLGNALGCARSTTAVDKLICAAKSMEDDNETLKNLLLPNEGKLPFQFIVFEAESNVVEKVLNVAKEIDKDTLKRLLFNDRYAPKTSALHIAAKRGCLCIIKVLLKAALDIEMLEELIIALDKEEKNVIELMFEHGHETISHEFLNIFEEDNYQNVQEKVKEMFNNVSPENRLCWYKKNLITAIQNDNIKEIKDILSKVKTSSVNGNESLRILLLDDKYFKKNILHVACLRGNSEIIQELLSYAKEMDGESHILKPLLLLKINGKSALHVAAENGHVNIMKLLLETAGIDILEEFIFGVNEEGKNAIQLIAELGHETIFAETFKMLKNEYPIIWEKAMEMFDNIPFERTFYSNKRKLIMAIERGDIQEVKDILSNAKHSSDSPNERLKILLLAEFMSRSTLRIACEEGNSKIIKELLFYAVHMEDKGETLKTLTQPRHRTSPFQALNYGYEEKIDEIVESLIIEARIFSREHAVRILKQIKNQELNNRNNAFFRSNFRRKDLPGLPASHFF